MEREKEIFEKYLEKRGLKLTSGREKILEEVFLRGDHFDAETLFQALRDKGEGVSRATVYRALPLLVDSGLVQEAMKCGDKVCYEHIYGHKAHGHLVCVSCGKIIEFRSNRLEKIKNEVCEKYDFIPAEFRFGIKGYCQDCREEFGNNR